MKALTDGVLSGNFWYYEIGLGIVVPSVLLLLSKYRSPFIIFISALSVMIGIYFMRFDLLYAGQIVAVTSGYLPKITYLEYTPTMAEISLLISSWGVAGLIYFLGEKYFNLQEEGDHA